MGVTLSRAGRLFLAAVATAVMALAFGVPMASANHIPYTIGEVFAGVGDGKINRYSPTGVFIEQLDTTSNSLEQTGMCFDGNTPTAHLRSTNFTANNMTRFNNLGGVVTHPWAGPFNADPESCVVAAGGIYVGQADGTRDILKFDPSGVLLDSFNVATGPRGSDWIDLSGDQCTMLYTSEGNDIYRYDVCTDTQLPNFATDFTAPGGSATCYALRIRANDEVLVACEDRVYRLSPAGTVVQTYPKPLTATSFLFALNIDPDGATFWTADFFTGNIYRYDITTGVILTTFNAVIEGVSLAGLAIFGEPVVSLPSGPATLTLDPKVAVNPVDTEHCVTATVRDAAGDPVEGVTVVFTVTGSVNTSAEVTTDANGEATFCYDGPAFPGADLIHAFADTDDDDVQDAGEPFDDAEKTWVLPVTTPGCEIKITNGGWIIAMNGDRSSFGGNAKADADGNVSGSEEYQDHGPAQPFNLHGNILVILCGADNKSATIFGTATIDGAGSHLYRIDVVDNGEPGNKPTDTYQIRIFDTAYDSGNQPLKGGNIQVKRTA